MTPSNGKDVKLEMNFSFALSVAVSHPFKESADSSVSLFNLSDFVGGRAFFYKPTNMKIAITMKKRDVPPLIPRADPLLSTSSSFPTTVSVCRPLPCRCQTEVRLIATEDDKSSSSSSSSFSRLPFSAASEATRCKAEGGPSRPRVRSCPCLLRDL